MIDGEAIVRLAHERHEQTLALLKQIVEFETPTSDKPALDRLIDFLEGQLRSRGASVERLVQSEYGDLLTAREDGNRAARLVAAFVRIDGKEGRDFDDTENRTWAPAVWRLCGCDTGRHHRRHDVKREAPHAVSMAHRGSFSS